MLGEEHREVAIDLDLDRLLTHGISYQEIIRTLRASWATMPAGKAVTEEGVRFLRVDTRFRTVAEVMDTVLRTEGEGRYLRLGELVVGGGVAPPARMVSSAQVNDGLFQGELIEVTGTLISVTELSFGNQDVVVQDATGTNVSIFVDSRNGMSTGDWPATGTMVKVKGVLGTDDRNDPGPRIEVRSTADVTTVPPAN